MAGKTRLAKGNTFSRGNLNIMKARIQMIKIIKTNEVAEDVDDDDYADDTSYVDYDSAESDDENIDEEDDEDDDASGDENEDYEDDDVDESGDEDDDNDSEFDDEDDFSGEESGDDDDDDDEDDDVDSGSEDDFHRGEKFVDEVLTPIFDSYDTVDDDVKELFLNTDM